RGSRTGSVGWPRPGGCRSPTWKIWCHPTSGASSWAGRTSNTSKVRDTGAARQGCWKSSVRYWPRPRRWRRRGDLHELHLRRLFRCLVLAALVHAGLVAEAAAYLCQLCVLLFLAVGVRVPAPGRKPVQLVLCPLGAAAVAIHAAAAVRGGGQPGP